MVILSPSKKNMFDFLVTEQGIILRPHFLDIVGMSYESQFCQYVAYLLWNFRLLFEKDKRFAKIQLGFLTAWQDFSLPRRNTIAITLSISPMKKTDLRTYSHLPYPTRCVLRAFLIKVSFSLLK